LSKGSTLRAGPIVSFLILGQPYAALEAAQQTEVSGDEAHGGLVHVCTFHPAYGHEDFTEGYRPQESAAGQLSGVAHAAGNRLFAQPPAQDAPGDGGWEQREATGTGSSAGGQARIVLVQLAEAA